MANHQRVPRPFSATHALFDRALDCRREQVNRDLDESNHVPIMP